MQFGHSVHFISQLIRSTKNEVEGLISLSLLGPNISTINPVAMSGRDVLKTRLVGDSLH
jgi:hypothetical protein